MTGFRMHPEHTPGEERAIALGGTANREGIGDIANIGILKRIQAMTPMPAIQKVSIALTAKRARLR
jgi:hypothetical protein